MSDGQNAKTMPGSFERSIVCTMVNFSDRATFAVTRLFL